MKRNDFYISVALFVAFASLYIYTAGPWVVPYRDAGEMTTLLATLGVAHPPGYPLYTLLGHLFVQIPLGNFAYRANVFSALAGALTLSLLFVLLRQWLSPTVAVIASVFLGLSHPFWELSVVSEMYTLGALMLIVVFLAATQAEDSPLLPFVMALSLGVRMDLLLLVPIFVGWRIYQKKNTNWIYFVLAFAVGISLFLYLPIRSLTDPILDWGNPETVSALFASMSRKSYGGTLDLISASYHTGENFGINLQLYAGHLWKSFNVGVLLAVLGLVAMIRRRWKPGLLLGIIFLVTGPLFLFLANMPPNPHSIAIVEASYLPADIIFVIVAAYGLGSLMEKTYLFRGAALFISFIGIGASAIYGYTRNDKRELWYGRDYAVNILRSLPPGAIAVLHDDVQLFTMWEVQAVEKKRLDASVIASGLSASPWYWEMLSRWGTQMAPAISVKTPEGWETLAKSAGDRPLRFGYDAEMPSPNLKSSGASLLGAARDDADTEKRFKFDPFSLFIRRGTYRYDAPVDFFSSDLIENFSRALHRHGLTLLLGNRLTEAVPFLIRASMMDLNFPRPLMDLGYIYFTANNFAAARAAYAESIRRGRFQLDEAIRFRATPDVLNGVKGDLSGAYVSFGGTEEKMGNKESARESYQSAIELNPGNAQAHYNLAVTYWGSDWNRVVEHMGEAVRLNPTNPDFQKFYATSLAKRAGR